MAVVSAKYGIIGMSGSASGVPAGMYPDPENPGRLRYWDGMTWAAPMPVPPPPLVGSGASWGATSSGNLDRGLSLEASRSYASQAYWVSLLICLLLPLLLGPLAIVGAIGYCLWLKNGVGRDQEHVAWHSTQVLNSFLTDVIIYVLLVIPVILVLVAVASGNEFLAYLGFALVGATVIFVIAWAITRVVQFIVGATRARAGDDYRMKYIFRIVKP